MNINYDENAKSLYLKLLDSGTQRTQFEEMILNNYQKESASTYRTFNDDIKITSATSTSRKLKSAKRPTISVHSARSVQKMQVSPVFDEKDEQELKKLRNMYEFGTAYKKYEQKKKQFFENYVIAKEVKKHVIPANYTEATVQQNHSKNIGFPAWITEREEFKEQQKTKYFNLNLKLVSICEIQSFKRDESQKTMVALYLQKLSLFKLMPFSMLVDLGGRLTTKQYEPQQVICNEGDRGDCMYIIYKGEVLVIANKKLLKVFQQNEHLGRNALETDAPRSATLIANKESHLLILSAVDYQQCLNNIFKIERPKWQSFLDQVLFFKNFPREKIERLCSEMKGRFMSTKDCLYKVGDKVDNFYVVKNGLLVKTVVVDIEKANRWPTASKQWLSRTITTRLSIPLQYPSQSLLGYFEIVTQETLGLKERMETIDAAEDCFLLYIPKTKFIEIFDADDLERFREYYVKTHPTSFDHLVEQVKKQIDQIVFIKREELHKRNEMKVLQNAIIENLQHMSTNTLEKKKNKYQKVIDHANNKFKTFQSSKKILRIEERKKYITSYYEQ